MQKHIDNVDYRDLFSFEICYPVFVDESHVLQEVLLSFVEEGCIVASIVTDKRTRDFRRLKSDQGEEVFKKAVAIVYIVKLTKEYLA